MAKSLNRIELIGRVGSVNVHANVVTVSIATGDRFKDKSSGEYREITDWHDVSFFGGLAKVATNHIKKGQQLFVSAKLKHKVVDNNGSKRKYTNIVADEIIFLGSKPASSQSQVQETAVSSDDDDIPF